MRNSAKKLPACCFTKKAIKKLENSLALSLQHWNRGKVHDATEHGKSGNSSFFKKFLLDLSSIVSGSCETIGEIIRILKSIDKELTNSEDFSNCELTLKLFCELYLFCDNKHPYKTLFSRLVRNSVWSETDVSNELRSLFHHVLESIHDFDLSEPQVIQTVEHLFRTFPTRVTSPILLKGLEYVSDVLMLHRSDLEEASESATRCENVQQCVQNLCADIKCASVLIQQCDHNLHTLNNGLNSEFSTSHPPYYDFAQVLMQEIRIIQRRDNLGWECWNAAGFLYALLIMSRSKSKSTSQLLEILNENKSNVDGVCIGSHIGLCNGSLVCLNTNAIKRESKHQYMESKEEIHALSNGATYDTTNCSSGDIVECLDCIFTYLMDLSKRVKTVPDQVALAKCFVQWIITMKNVIKFRRECNVASLFSQLKSLQFYATVCLDHPVDVIRHQAKDILINVLTVCGSKDTSPDLATFSRELISNAFEWDWHKRPVYIFLLCCAEFIDVEYVLKQDSNLIERLLTACVSQALAPYASQLYLQYAQMHGKRISPSSFNNRARMDYWLKPALSFMLNCNVHQCRLLVDYTIVKLLKLYGYQSVNYLVLCLKEEVERQKKKTNFLLCLVLCLKPAQRLGLMQKAPMESNGDNKDYDMDSELIKSALVCQDKQVRLDAFCLFCESWRPSALVSKEDCDLIRYALPYNMTCQCPAFRQQLLVTIKKFLQRLSLNLESLRKGKHGSMIGCQARIEIYAKFEKWILSFCFDNLFDGASFPRKNLALNLLDFMLNEQLDVRKELTKMTKIFTLKRIVLLVDLLKDGYEDNRQLALNILCKESWKSHVRISLGSSCVWDLVESSLKTGRYSCKPEVCRDAVYNLRLAAKISQSVNRNIITMCKFFVSSLRSDVKIASQNLLKAVRSGPMHGSLLCLRMLLTDADTADSSHFPAYRKLMSECAELCYEVAAAVFPVVGSDSPEGYVPEVRPEMELPNVYKEKYERILRALRAQQMPGQESDEIEQISGQKMLVMCWRSAKESYLLLQLISTLAAKHASDEESSALLSWKQFLKIGEHLRSQLVNTVHRGTFEVAYSAFRDYCPLLWRSKTAGLRFQPEKWLRETVADLCDSEKAKMLCSTRRSAGLPFFLQALLGSDRSQLSRDCLCHVMDSLLPLVSCVVIARFQEQDDCSQQIHVLNILRGLIKDASLAEDIMPYLSKCVMTAIIGFGSKVWRIRNSSTLLFAALVTRIFGVKKEKDLETSGKNRLSSHEFFTRMPELHEFLLDYLRKNTTTNCAGTHSNSIEQDANLYPVLLLLSRVYPSPTRQQELTELLPLYQPFLTRCGSSPIYKCRVMAASAIVSASAADHVSSMLTHLTQSLGHDLPANQIHGILLQIHKFIAVLMTDTKHVFKIDDQVKILAFVTNSLAEKRELSMRKTSCLVVQSSYIKLCLDISAHYFNNLNKREATGLPELSKAIPNLLKHLLQESLATQTAPVFSLPGHTMLAEAYGELFAFSWLWGISDDSLFFPLRCTGNDVTPTFLKTLKKNFESEEKCQALLQNTAKASQLENALVQIASSTLEKRCQAKIFALLSRFVSVIKSAEVLELLRPLMTEKFWRHDKLVGAVVSCQAACLKNIMTSDSHVDASAKVLEPLRAWILLLERACSVVRHRVCVRLCVAGSLRILASQMLIDVEQTYSSVCAQAWKILFLLLVDEEELVRNAATSIVNDVARTCDVPITDELPVDSLAIEVALQCLLACHSRNSAIVQLNFQFLSDLTGIEDLEEESPAGAAEQSVFDRGASNVYIETTILRQLVEKAKDSQLSAWT